MTEIKEVTVIEEFHSHLTCLSSTGERLIVFKPTLLRNVYGERSGVNYKPGVEPGIRVASKGDVCQTERLIPPYLPGDSLVVAMLGLPIDLNVDQRGWAAGE